MKALIIGYGSMGRRRIRLLDQIVKNTEFICVDSNPERLEQINKDGYTGYAGLPEAIMQHPDIAFVCTSPGHHAGIILELVKAGIPTFTELNLVSDLYNEIITLSNEKNVPVFMSSTMLYDKQILSIQKKLSESQNHFTYIFHIGQYLADWHPWESYKNFFIGKKETNGCREIFAIQLPWIIKTFGKIKDFSVIKKKNSSLDIDFDDTYIVSFDHENGNSGVFICDVLARKAINYLEIMGDDTHIIWNGTPETLTCFEKATNEMQPLASYENIEHLEEYADIISENQYIDEIKAFLDYVKLGKTPLYDFTDDKYILDLIDKIEGYK